MSDALVGGVSRTDRDHLDSILAFIKDCTEGRGYPPSVDEVRIHEGWASKSTAHAYLTRLRESGRIRVEAGKPRTMRVVEEET